MENEERNNRIEELEKENDDLSTKLIDLTFELNYNKEKELLELVRELYKNISEELVCKESKLTKKQILTSVKKYLEQFAKDNKIKL
jgi:flagellin-specific chaperone FliS